MSFAELVLAAVFLFGLYKILGPVQKRLERYFLQKWQRGGRKSRSADVIDIKPRKD